MNPLDVYKTYLAFKNHFTKENYDYFQYCGKSKASKDSFNKRKDRYFFERMSRKKNDEEIKQYFLANFVECDDPQTIWIGDIIDSGEERFNTWAKKVQSLTYLFKTEISFIDKSNLENTFKVTGSIHPPILKKFLSKEISLETMVILDCILGFSKKLDNKLFDPIWETVSFRIKKYKPFLNTDISKYSKILKELVI